MMTNVLGYVQNANYNGPVTENIQKFSASPSELYKHRETLDLDYFISSKGRAIKQQLFQAIGPALTLKWEIYIIQIKFSNLSLLDTKN